MGIKRWRRERVHNPKRVSLALGAVHRCQCVLCPSAVQVITCPVLGFLDVAQRSHEGGSRLFYPQLRFLVSSFIKAIFPLERRAHRGFWCEEEVWETGQRGFWYWCSCLHFQLWFLSCFLMVIYNVDWGFFFLKKQTKKSTEIKVYSIFTCNVLFFWATVWDSLGLFHDCSCDLTLWSK